MCPTVVRYLLAGCPWLSLRCESPGVTFGECCPFDAAARTAATWPAADTRARPPGCAASPLRTRIPLCLSGHTILLYSHSQIRTHCIFSRSPPTICQMLSASVAIVGLFMEADVKSDGTRT